MRAPCRLPHVITDRRGALPGCLAALTEPLGDGAHRLSWKLALALRQIHELALPRVKRIRWLAGPVASITLADTPAALRLLFIGSRRETRSVLLLRLVPLTFTQSLEQLLLLLRRHLLERLTRTPPEVLGLLLLTLCIIGTVGQLAQPVGQALGFARLLWFLLCAGLLALFATLWLLLARFFALSG